MTNIPIDEVFRDQVKLSSASRSLKAFQVEYDNYPTTIDCSIANSSTNLCLKPGDNATYTYQVDNTIGSQSFTLYATSTLNGKIFKITDGSVAEEVAEIPISCPTGFIPIPGSSTYGTDDFCVMKYEAKIYGNDNGAVSYSSSNLPSSRASGTPYVNISQTNAITQATKAVDQSGNTISGAHLITESEWMTIAQNVLSVASNWSSGTVGTGYIYSGHNDNSPATALEASTDDGNGYANTGNTSGNQKRTLTLTNGEVIWDLAGNVYDWTTSQTTGGQPGISGGGYAWRQYTALTTTGSLTVNIFPSGTGISGSGSWTNNNGIGTIYSSADETVLHGFVRGGNWGSGSTGSNNAGVLCLMLGNAPGDTAAGVGFRVSSSGI